MAVSAEDVKDVVGNFGPVKLTLGRVKHFSADTYDVLYVEVRSKDVVRLHAALCELPHEKTHPNYVPHVTLAYVKKGLGEEYAKEIGYPRTWPTVTSDEIVFSSRDRTKTAIPLTDDPYTSEINKYARLRGRDEWGPVGDAAYDVRPGGKQVYSYPHDEYREHLNVMSDFLQDEGDFRHHIVKQHATAERNWVGPLEHLHDLLDTEHPIPVGHQIFRLSDGTRILAQVRERPDKKRKAVCYRWIVDNAGKERWADTYESYFTPEDGRKIADEMPDDLREQVHGFLDQHLPPRTDSPEKYAAYKAPAGGIVVRGTFYQGGSMIPDLQKYEKGHKKPKRHRLRHAIRKLKGAGTTPYTVVTPDGEGDGGGE